MTNVHEATSNRWLRLSIGVGAAALIALLAPAASPADAHCDSVNGPVVAAAKRSLSSGDPRYVQAYVAPDSEAEIASALREALRVRQLGPAARQMSERYFYETAVRLHRAGEGAPYTGLKDNLELGPALEAAERALESGKSGDTRAVLQQAMTAGLDRRWRAVGAARSAAGKNPSVEALRAVADAELAYELYVNDVYTALGASGHGAGTEAEAAAQHSAAPVRASNHVHGAGQ